MGESATGAAPAGPARIAAALSLALAAVVAPALMAVANRSAPAVEVAAALAAILAFGLAPRRLAWPRATPLGLAGLAFALYCVASLAWSVDPRFTLSALFQMAPVVVAGLVLVALAPALWPRGRAGRWLAAGVLVGSALIAIEALWSPPLPLRRLVGAREIVSDLKRAATPLVVMVFPALALLAPRDAAPDGRARLLGAALIASAASAVLLAHAGSSMLGLAVGVVVLALATLWPRLAAATVAAAILTALAAAPLVAPLMDRARGHVDLLERFHANHRLSIWRAFGDRIPDHLWFGHGFATAPRLGGLPRADGSIDMTARLLIEDIHTHSHPLQIWVELGLVGAALAALTLTLLTLRLARGRGVPTRLAALAAAFAAGLTSFGVWQAWWGAVLALTIALFAAEGGERRGSEAREHGDR